MRSCLYRWLAIIVALGLAASCSKSSINDRVTMVGDDDPEMNAAIKKARDTLPKFWQKFSQPRNGEQDFALKVRIVDGEGGEHFWLTDLERKDGKIFGTVNNEPEIVGNVKMGERREIPEADISDWLYVREGKMHGNFTIRPLFKSMSPEEVKQLKQMLSDPES